MRSPLRTDRARDLTRELQRGPSLRHEGLGDTDLEDARHRNATPGRVLLGGALLLAAALVLPTRGAASPGAASAGAVSPGAVSSPAPGDGCPDERASEVAAAVHESKAFTYCGTGVVLFGLELSFQGERCPEWRVVYPAHQTCSGETLAGHRCVPEDPLPVTLQECTCERYAIPLLEIGIASPFCECDDALETGHVEDFETEVCPGSAG
jgi:hypothetical protein